MTKSDLEQLTLLNSEISRDLERLQELYALLTGCTSSIRGLPLSVCCAAATVQISLYP